MLSSLLLSVRKLFHSNPVKRGPGVSCGPRSGSGLRAAEQVGGWPGRPRQVPRAPEPRVSPPGPGLPEWPPARPAGGSRPAGLQTRVGGRLWEAESLEAGFPWGICGRRVSRGSGRDALQPGLEGTENSHVMWRRCWCAGAALTARKRDFPRGRGAGAGSCGPRGQGRGAWDTGVAAGPPGAALGLSVPMRRAQEAFQLLQQQSCPDSRPKQRPRQACLFSSTPEDTWVSGPRDLNGAYLLSGLRFGQDLKLISFILHDN